MKNRDARALSLIYDGGENPDGEKRTDERDRKKKDPGAKMIRPSTSSSSRAQIKRVKNQRSERSAITSERAEQRDGAGGHHKYVRILHFVPSAPSLKSVNVREEAVIPAENYSNVTRWARLTLVTCAHAIKNADEPTKPRHFQSTANVSLSALARVPPRATGGFFYEALRFTLNAEPFVARPGVTAR